MFSDIVNAIANSKDTIAAMKPPPPREAVAPGPGRLRIAAVEEALEGHLGHGQPVDCVTLRPFALDLHSCPLVVSNYIAWVEKK